MASRLVVFFAKQSIDMKLSLLLIFLVAAVGPAFQAPEVQNKSVMGRWQVNLSLSGGGPTTLELLAQDKGKGSFQVLTGSPEQQTQAVPATWSQTTNDRVNSSGEIELKFSACCTETGTLILKGKFKSTDSITGKAIYIATTENEENFTGYVSTVGTFTATRMPDAK
jgi:hypothetical protein